MVLEYLEQPLLPFNPKKVDKYVSVDLVSQTHATQGRHIRIYFQTPDMRLGELCNDNLDGNWFMGEYKTDVAMEGTSIAVLQDPYVIIIPSRTSS